MDLSFVGAGRVGTALAVLLARSGHRVVGASGREASRARVEAFLPGVPFLSTLEAARKGQVVVLGVPDDAIADVCAELAAEGAFRSGQSVVHLSGAVSLLALGPARAAEARVLVVHPLQTFPDVETGIERLPGSSMAVTAWDEAAFRLGEDLARAAGGRAVRVLEEHKALYHAAAVFCSNYMVVVEAVAERLFRAAGLEDPVPALAPLAGATLDSVVRAGPVAALTGPVARGDAGSVRRNLEALSSDAPDVVPAYVALAEVALDLADRGGKLGPDGRQAVQEVLDQWR